jgi:selenocysteine lyase/cysteine desulfurase
MGSQFLPALNSGDNFIFFDNGAGAEVPQVVLDAVQNHVLTRHVQSGGRYRRSKELDASSSARNFNLEPDGKRYAVTSRPQ